MGLKYAKKESPNDKKKSTHKTKRVLKILRTSSGSIKRTSKFTGFIKSSLLSRASTNALQKLGAKKKGNRQKLKEEILKNKQKIDKTKNKQKNEEEEEEILLNTQKGYFDVIDEVKKNKNIQILKVQLSPEDEKILEQFKLIETTNQTKKNKKNNAEEITLKISETFMTELQNKYVQEVEKNYFKNAKILVVYQDVAELLKNYRSGKLPQPFHVIPTVGHWQDLLKLTKPEDWSPQAIYAATKIFISSMNNDKAEYYFKEVILPAVRKNIHEEKRLNFHLYHALIKGLYKPEAWIKGILFELCKQPDVLLREAQIIGSIIHKHSLPPIHGSIIIFKLLQFEFSGIQQVMLKVMIDKKYSLPQKVVNELVIYFLKFKSEQKDLPVIWHQCLLRFCELYLQALTQEQKQQIKNLIQSKKHHQITPEILKVFQQKQNMEME